MSKMICNLLDGEFSLLAAAGDLTAAGNMQPSLNARLNKIVGKEIVYILRRAYKICNRRLLTEILSQLDRIPVAQSEPVAVENAQPEILDGTPVSAENAGPEIATALLQSAIALIEQQH